jgi:NAD(P) transhydrogenase subunit alpha
MEDEAIRGLTVIKDGAITWPPPPPKAPAAPPQAKPRPRRPPPRATAMARGEPMAGGSAGHHVRRRRRAVLAGRRLRAGQPSSSHFTVFVLACFIGYMVVWNVTPALHTPLMSVTNAISSIIAIGALVQIAPPLGDGAAGRPDELIRWLAVGGIALTAINMFGGFAVTRRMLAMFRK